MKTSGSPGWFGGRRTRTVGSLPRGTQSPKSWWESTSARGAPEQLDDLALEQARRVERGGEHAHPALAPGVVVCAVSHGAHEPMDRELGRVVGDFGGGDAGEITQCKEHVAFMVRCFAAGGESDPLVGRDVGWEVGMRREGRDALGRGPGGVEGPSFVDERGDGVGGAQNAGAEDLHPDRDLVGRETAARPVDGVGGLGDGHGRDRRVELRGGGVGVEQLFGPRDGGVVAVMMQRDAHGWPCVVSVERGGAPMSCVGLRTAAAVIADGPRPVPARGPASLAGDDRAEHGVERWRATAASSGPGVDEHRGDARTQRERVGAQTRGAPRIRPVITEDLGHDTLWRQIGRGTEERRVSQDDTAHAAKHRRAPARTGERCVIEDEQDIEGAQAVVHTMPGGPGRMDCDLVVLELAAHRLERVVRVDLAGGRADTDRVACLPCTWPGRDRPKKRERGELLVAGRDDGAAA